MDKQTLLLTSQGIQPELKEVFLTLLPKTASEIRVAFDITAAHAEEYNPKWLDVYRNQLRDCGINNIEEINLQNFNREKLERTLENKDLIFVNGGNTFYLLDWVRKSGLGQVIQKHLERGMIYVGVSAGSYIACPTIEQATWKHQDNNKVGLTDLTALNLVPFLISAHYSEKYKELIEKAAKTTNYPIVALTDTQAVLVKGDSYQIVGKGDKVTFNNFNES